MLDEPAVDRSLVAQVERLTVDRHDFTLLARQPPHQRRPYHTAVTGDKQPTPFQRKDRSCHVNHLLQEPSPVLPRQIRPALLSARDEPARYREPPSSGSIRES